VKRILLLALFFFSLMEFALEHARIDLLFMTVALAVLLWGGLHSLRRAHAASTQESKLTPKEPR
jgi:hypothetical protein